MNILKKIIVFLSIIIHFTVAPSMHEDKKHAEEIPTETSAKPPTATGDVAIEKKLILDNEDKKHALDVAILLESGRLESFYRPKAGALIQTLADLISQKTVPVIVSGVILHALLWGAKRFAQSLKIKDSSAQKFNELIKKQQELDQLIKQLEIDKAAAQTAKKKPKPAEKEQPLSCTSEISDSIEELKATLAAMRIETAMLLKQYQDEAAYAIKEAEITKAINALEKDDKQLSHHYFYLHTNFDFDEWDIYKHNTAELYLLIPKNYRSQFAKTDQRQTHLGFNINDNKILTKITTIQKLESILSATWDSKSAQRFATSATLSNIFSSAFPEYQTINLDALESFFTANSGPWNIYLSGHGLYSDMGDAEKGLETSAGWIAGLTNKQFAHFLKFISQLNTLSLTISTCYGGGYNLSMTSKYMQILKEKKIVDKQEAKIINESGVKNIIISTAITDATTSGPALTASTLTRFLHARYILDFNNFFKTLDGLATTKKDRLDQLLTDALRYIADWQGDGDEDLHGISGVPSVWYPGLAKPKALEVGDKVLVITDKQRGQEISDKKALLIYSKKIDFPLTIIVGKSWDARSPAIVSMSPENIITTFEKMIIKVRDTDKDQSNAGLKGAMEVEYFAFNKFLEESIFQLKSVFKKRYFIKKLLVSNYEKSGILDSLTGSPLELEDVAIKKSLTDDEKIKGQVIFKVKNKNGIYIYYVGQWDHKTRNIKTWKSMSTSSASKEYKKYME